MLVVARSTGLHRLGGMERHTDGLLGTLRTRAGRVSLITTPLPPGAVPWPGVAVVPAGDRPGAYSRRWWREVPRRVRELAARDTPDLVISQSTAAQSAVPGLLAAGIPLVYILHGSAADTLRSLAGHYDPRSLYRRWRLARAWAWNRRVLPQVPRLVAVNRRQAQSLLRDLPLDPARLLVLENPVDPGFRPARDGAERAAARRRLGLPATGPVAGYAGRLAAGKGVDLLLAWARSRPGVTLALAGEGPLAAVAGGLAPAVRLLGRLAGEELAVFYRALDCLALPSREPEGLPLAALEAGASGVPLVAFATGGLADLAEEGSVLGVVPGDIAGLFAALDRVLADEALRRRLAAAAAARPRRSWEEWTDTLLAFALADVGESGSGRIQ
ncbi:conserved protein of unknown function [Candidatus Hydrogenisulfobacillus filiaventi]|uniref:Uncharacterized protein n=1 Tax=Candidatus Hydrogenisulfobacillus filiaventi TaxID=2707344 RepID=A0A6F8ZDG9_9FIRM|nr:glycosyltransferase family 4 protein [Bacillota bacterium]CAB1127807.1 conserved protein of unknown function [Candidatus Hydrogenisulfobacillus filiaventi]